MDSILRFHLVNVRGLSLLVSIFVTAIASAQPTLSTDIFTGTKAIAHTSVKDQANTGTCWSFSMISLVESQSILNGLGSFDLSEMFTVRNAYLDKARNYVLRQGKAQFGPGGLGHDVLAAMEEYGAVPESVYSGRVLGDKRHDHAVMDKKLKLYLDSLLTVRPLQSNWMEG